MPSLILGVFVWAFPTQVLTNLTWSGTHKLCRKFDQSIAAPTVYASVARTLQTSHLEEMESYDRGKGGLHGPIYTGLPASRLEGAGIAQWLECRTRDWKVAGSNPCWNGGRIFFSRGDFLCWLLFRYPFHPRVTTVARKISPSFCQKCRWQVTAKHAYTLRMWILLNRASALVTTCP